MEQVIKKEIIMYDGEKYLIGFKEVGSQMKVIECHILEKGLFTHESVFSKLRIKGMSPDYHQMAFWTVLDYKRECEQKEQMLTESWV